jgi:hypothetical protein
MQKEENEVPFFARYLEGGEYPEVRTGVKAGAITNKLLDNLEQTQKAPSDSDEI